METSKIKAKLVQKQGPQNDAITNQAFDEALAQELNRDILPPIFVNQGSLQNRRGERVFWAGDMVEIASLMIIEINGKPN